MSVNITVNGKFGRHCQKHTLLLDPEKARKEEEAERRKIRLLQVREQSKKIAEQIRNNVKESMRKEMQKIEATKAKEYEEWRRKTMQQKEKDYREAVFQVGMAHRAAQAENQAQAEKKAKQGTYKDFKKQMAARRRYNENCPNPGPCICSKLNICPKEKSECKCSQQRTTVEEPQKRKRDSCFSSSDSETSDSDGETSNEETLKDISTSSSVTPFKSATTTASTSNRATQTSLKLSEKNLRKTPAVYLDVEVGSEDSVVITAPVEMKDKHVENNRQFSRIIRVSPRKNRNKTEARTDNKQTQTAFTSSKSSSADSRENPTDICKEMEQNIQAASHVSAAGKEKRFTIISDLVNKQQYQPKHAQQSSPNKRSIADTNPHISPSKFKAMPAALTTRPPVSRPISQPTTPPVSPRKGSISSKSSKVISGGHTHPTSISAASAANTVAMGSTSSSSCRVQFFDYNSKLTKEGAQTQTHARVNRHSNAALSTAMEQAGVENRLVYDKQQDILIKNKQMEELGQKALEREQVRRDCNELTEKLEALTRQYPRQMPTNDNPAPHVFADKQLRKEGKMNTAVEKLLSRPNIITCSEITANEMKAPPQPMRSTNSVCNEINVGTESDKALPADDVSSDSCCSILLGYVDDQSRQVRKDLEQWPDRANNQKQKRLQNLLQRLDQLRNSLVQELKSNSNNTKVKNQKSSTNEEHYIQLIDDITKYRQERENIMIDDIVKQQKPKDKGKLSSKDLRETEKSSNKKQTQQPLEQREKLLQQKEAILEEKLKEFYELQKQQKKLQTTAKRKESSSSEQTASKEEEEQSDLSENKENINCTALETPVEIVITVQGETKSIKIPVKNKKRMTPKKNPTQLATLIRSPQPKGAGKKATPKKKLGIHKENGGNKILGRQNSYDSNSTSYMSLPPHMHNQLEALVEKKQQQQQRQHPHSLSSPEDTQTSVELENDDGDSQVDNFKKPAIPHLNPLVAQYVQRLLGMSRNAIQRLGVSSSDIESPSSTLINNSENKSTSDSLNSDERIACVESFVQENRSFIKELERSLRAQNDTSLENSMRTFEEIWRKRLKQPTRQANKIVEQKNKPKVAKSQPNENKSKVKSPKLSKESTAKERNQTQELQNQEITSQTKLPTDKPGTSKSYTSHSTKIPNKPKRTEDFESGSDILTINKKQPSSNQFEQQRRSSDKADKSVETRIYRESNTNESDSQIARYAQLTENCTHRIAELTELINRVREEKQRLLEVTLSSVSDTGRQSTEYLELPDAKSRTTNDAESSSASSTEEAANTKLTSSSEMVRQIPKLSALEKNCPITASQDSGIAESRPITAQENRTDLEPISQTSTESQSNLHQRKLKPPPTLRRFSPQFQEDELVHELSTILEVDTPANSRINTAVGQGSEERVSASVETPRQAAMFPTFEDYIQQMNLDITQLDEEQSMQLQQEFSHFIEDLQRSQTKRKEPQYNEFPSIGGYMNHSKSNLTDQADAMEDSLAQLRLSGLQANRFPAVREYVQRNKATTATTPPNDDDPQMLDTESLENITDVATQTNTENESASLDIEKELKDRKILRNSFRYTKSKQQIFSSTAHHDGNAFYNELMAAESGVEKLSTSDNTMAILETDLQRMVYQWPSDGKKKSHQQKQQQQYQALSTTTTSTTTTESKQDKKVKSPTLDESSNEIGRPLNLRDFLTRELLKHANFSASTTTTTTTSSSIDDSLRSQFLYSFIGSLTPRTNAATSKSGQHTLDRQKTSTPVPIQSSKTHSTASNPTINTSSQLFSGESRLSSVHGYGAQADHSSE